MSLQKNTILNERYALLHQLGKGSFGEVWLAKDLQLGIEVAIKVYVALDGNGCKEFGREYLRMRSLLHTNLLRTDYYALYGDRPFLVMEYCPSGARELIGKADEITLLRFIRDVASGLAYMHQHDMLHRDIKPDNILRKADGTFVLTDFGLSKNMHSTLLRNSSRNLSADSVDNLFAGTVEYMAPELFTPDPLAVKATDVWALGVTLYEIITGEVPFFGKGGSMMNFGAAVPNIYASLSTNLIDTVRGCMAKDPWDRPTAQQLADWAQSGIDYYNESSYAAKTPSTDTPNPDLLVNADNPETGSDSGNEVLSDLPVEKHHRRIWPWATVAALVVLGIAGLLVWKFVKPKVDIDAEFFAKCQKSNSIGLYRSYLELYPQGNYVEDVKAWIQHYDDSIAELSLTQDSTQIAENQAEVQPISPTEKPKDKDRNGKEGKETERNYVSDNSINREGSSIPFPSGKSLDELNNNNSTDNGLTSSSSGLSGDKSKNGIAEGQNNKGESQGGLTSDKTSTDKSKNNRKRNEMTEQELAENASTLEDCYYYVEKFGNKGQYIADVRRKFNQLYAKKLGACKTKTDFERFLKEHDGIMKKMRLDGSVEDRNWRSRIEKKLKEFV